MSFSRFAFVSSLALVIACGSAAEEASVGESDLTSSFHGKSVDVDDSMPDVDAIGYDVELTAKPEAGKDISALRTYSAKVKGVFVATKDLSSVDLDFEGNQIASIEVGGAAAPYERVGDKLSVQVGRKSKGATIEITIAYEGAFYVADGANPNDFARFGGLMLKKDNAVGKPIVTSMNWPSKARRWLPLRDHPRDGAMISMKLTFPADLEVVANGERKGAVANADGTRTWSYEALTAMPTYDFHLSAYDGWSVVTSHPQPASSVVTYTYAEHASVGKRVFDDVNDAFTFFSGSFSPYAWGNEVRYLEEPIFGGGMEHATVISLDETLYDVQAEADAEQTRDTIAHELAHHWSGNLSRIAQWNDLWLSEGFADYLTYRFVEDNAGVAAALQRWQRARSSVVSARQHPLRPQGREIDPLEIFDSITYKKGAFVLRMLEQKVGRDAFTTFLAGWFKRHAFKSVTTEQLRTELEAETKTSLKTFFDDFIYGQGSPSATVSAAAVAGRAVEVKVSTEAGAFDYDLEVAVYGEPVGGKAPVKSVTIPIKKSERVTTVRVPVDFVYARAEVDPSCKMLGTFRVTP